jgi:hypothetical protein
MPRRTRPDSLAGHRPAPVTTSIVLWKAGKATCTCRTAELDHIEIVLTVDGVVAQSGWFDHHQEASRFAIDMRRAYTTP